VAGGCANSASFAGGFVAQATNKMSERDLQAEIARLQDENEGLKKRSVRGITCKVSEKGALLLDGVGRFLVTFYKEHWRRVLSMAAEIEAYIVEAQDEGVRGHSIMDLFDERWRPSRCNRSPCLAFAIRRVMEQAEILTQKRHRRRLFNKFSEPHWPV
jgi:hypothetical protein